MDKNSSPCLDCRHNVGDIDDITSIFCEVYTPVEDRGIRWMDVRNCIKADPKRKTVYESPSLSKR